MIFTDTSEKDTTFLHIKIIWRTLINSDVYAWIMGTRCSVVGWGTISQIERLLARFPMRSLNFLYLPYSSSRIRPWSSLSVQQKLVPQREKCFWGVQCGCCVRLTTSLPSLSIFSKECQSLNTSESYGPPQPVSGIALL
jgi:hypothetical protein